MKQTVPIAVALLLAWTAAAAAGDSDYVDDRSDAASLVVSLYNAIDRKEYARAWSYFADPPAKDFVSYVEGFADTDGVELEIGEVFSEGAAGSVFSSVPVVIRPSDANGNTKVFAGCYTVRAVNAAVQDPPFRPLQIEKGKLSPVSGDPGNVMPDCGAGKADPVNSARAEAIALFRNAFANQCEAASPERTELEPEEYSFSFRYDYQTDSEPAQNVTLYVFPCATFAYNWSNVYLMKRDTEAPEVMSFAEPSLDVTYEDEAQEKPKAISVVGFNAQQQLVNSEFDPASQTISFFAKGRGMGDLSSSGTYVFADGIFRLKDYAYDGTANGEVDPVDLMRDGKVLEPKL